MTYDEVFAIIKTWNLDDLARLQDDLNFEMHKRPLTLTPEWQAELQRREVQLERGEVKLIPWSEARERAREAAGLEPLSD